MMRLRIVSLSIASQMSRQHALGTVLCYFLVQYCTSTSYGMYSTREYSIAHLYSKYSTPELARVQVTALILIPSLLLFAE